MISEKIINIDNRSFIVKQVVRDGSLTDEQMQQIKKRLNSDIILKSNDGRFLICDEIVDAIIIETPEIKNSEIITEST
jgi:hypothetical protein